MDIKIRFNSKKAKSKTKKYEKSKSLDLNSKQGRHKYIAIIKSNEK